VSAATTKGDLALVFIAAANEKQVGGHLWTVLPCLALHFLTLMLLQSMACSVGCSTQGVQPAQNGLREWMPATPT